jgi:hypothetical protein
MNRYIYSLIALTFFALPVSAADSAVPEGALPRKDPNSPLGPGGNNWMRKPGAATPAATSSTSSTVSTSPVSPATSTGTPSATSTPSLSGTTIPSTPSTPSTPTNSIDATTSPDLSVPGASMSGADQSSDAPLRGPARMENEPAPNGVLPPQSQTPPAEGYMGPVPGQNPIDFGRSSTDNQVPLGDSLSGAATAPGSGQPARQLSAHYSTVSATAKMLKVAPLMRCRDENMQFVEIKLRNDSAEVALVHGDIAEAKVGGSMRTAASARYIGTVASPKLDMKGRILTGLVTVGSWGFAGPIFYENLTPEQHQKRYRGTAVGVDGSRHEIEDQRFGLRVLMPGEETVGWLAFECPDASSLTSLLIPVNYSRSQLPSGSLVVKVKAADESDKLNPAPPIPTVIPGSGASKASSSSTNYSSPSSLSPYPALGPDTSKGIDESGSGSGASSVTPQAGQSSTRTRQIAPAAPATNPLNIQPAQPTPPLRGQ